MRPPDRDDAASGPVVALVGQPNCGKSTLFNAIAGYRVVTGNFPGTTVAFTESAVAIGPRRARVIDLPGTYSLVPRDGAEEVTRDFLLGGRADVIVAVADASVLSRSLELILQVLDLRRPMVVALNMMDEARRKGVRIDLAALADRLGVPVIPVVATRGEGVSGLVRAALDAASRPFDGLVPRYDNDVEEVLAELEARLPAGLAAAVGAPPRFVAVRLAEGDDRICALAERSDPDFSAHVRTRRRMVADAHGWPEDSVFSLHRHAVSVGLAESVSRVERRPGRSVRERLDDWATHPVLGLLVALAALAGLFGFSFLVGNALASLLAVPMDALASLARTWAGEGLGAALLGGLVEGVAGGVGIVLPYLLPLLLVMALLEDSGYLPRAAFLLDGLMHRIGLHGKSVIPLVLSYGCNVPALMVTRILESRRDRVITGLLVPLVPCSARTVVILALVAGVLGPGWAVGVYVLNLLVAAAVGRILARISRSEDAGLVMDIPPWRVPPLRAIGFKVWLRMREFLVSAWPVIVVASVVMGALEWAGIGTWFNAALAPLTTGVLGLPAVLGVTLVFGVLRKELALVMLFSALGTEDVASVLSPAQILGFSLFVTFYVPCVATVTTLARELGWRWAGVSVVLNTGLAVVIASAARLLG